MARKTKKSERFFSLMFVPDQEKDPRSVSMNYLQGRLIVIGLVVIGLHLIGGLIAYVEIYRKNREIAELEHQSEVLAARNSRIEPLIVELNEMKSIVDKIRKGFGNTLGLDKDVGQMLIDIPASRYSARAEVPSAIANRPDNRESDSPTTNYMVFQRQESYFDPEYMPTRLPVEGYLTSHFTPSSWYRHRNHLGIDIAAEKGASVHAAGSGHVLFANWTPDLGHVIIISHGNGFYSYYGHAMRLLVGQGNFVKKGQQIALLGSSGISSAPHVHFEIWKDGKAIDPEAIVLIHRDNKPTES